MKALWNFKSFLLIVLVFFSVGYLYFRWSQETRLSHDRHTTTVKRQDLIQRVTIAGNIEPKRKTIVTAPFNGYVKKLYVRVGDKVKTGDPLVSVTQSLQSTDPVFPLRAPFAGTVVQVEKEEGEYVPKDSTTDYILRVDSLDELFITSLVPEMDSVKIVPGQEVVIKASAILDKKYKGVLESISLASKSQESWRGNSKVEYLAKIKILDFDKSLRPGMSTIIDIIISKKENALVLPHEYIYKKEGQYYAVLSDKTPIPIEIGQQNESFFEVVNGLKEGQSVLQVDFLQLLTGSDEK